MHFIGQQCNVYIYTSNFRHNQRCRQWPSSISITRNRSSEGKGFSLSALFWCEVQIIYAVQHDNMLGLYRIVLFCLKYCCNRVKVCMYILIYTYQWLLELKIIVMGVFRGLINENKTWADWHSLLWTTLCLWLALTYCHNISLHIQNWGQALLGPCIVKGKGAVA